MQGTVALFKGNYGFIEAEDIDDDVFFHVSEIEGDTIEEGTEVEFTQEEGDKGPKAVDVTEV